MIDSIISVLITFAAMAAFLFAVLMFIEYPFHFLAFIFGGIPMIYLIGGIAISVWKNHKNDY